MVGMRTETLMWSIFLSDHAGGYEGVVAGRDGGGGADAVGDRVEGLEAHAGVDDDGLERGVELAGLDELLRHADGRAAGGLREDPLGAGEEQDALADLVVGDVLDGTAGAA